MQVGSSVRRQRRFRHGTTLVPTPPPPPGGYHPQYTTPNLLPTATPDITQQQQQQNVHPRNLTPLLPTPQSPAPPPPPHTSDRHRIRHRLRAAFTSFDVDGGGSLDINEVYQALTANGFVLSFPIFEMVRKAYDSDGGGTTGFDEFIQMVCDLSSLTALFRSRDPAGTGRATLVFDDLVHAGFAIHT